MNAERSSPLTSSKTSSTGYALTEKPLFVSCGSFNPLCVTHWEGIAKPEPLRGKLSGIWSRRLTQEHRVVYEPSGDVVLFLQARYHY